MSETITSAIDFLRIIQMEKEVYVKFVKKDNTIRLMKCTLDFTKIPQDKRPKSVDLRKILTKIEKSKMLFIRDNSVWTLPFIQIFCGKDIIHTEYFKTYEELEQHVKDNYDNCNIKYNE